jgi:response regulator RpfG family c-di-GMP phosphodiesterase
LLKTNQPSGCIKANPLTHAERKIMEQDPIVGERICEPLRPFWRVLPVIRHHHEKMEGSGYPYGLKADETPTVPQVTTVDVSLRSKRADEALVHIIR